MNVRNVLGLVVLFFALGASAENPYTVTVPEGTTNEFSEADLTALGSGTYDVLVKDGPGALHVHPTDIMSFAGEIRIKEGVWFINENAEGGFFGTSAGATYVSSNAAIHVAAPSPENTCKFTGEEFFLEGDGPDGRGVVYNSSVCDETRLFSSYGSVTLTGDALITSRYRIDFCYYAPLKLNGHRLHYRSYDTGGIRSFGMTTSGFSMGAGDSLVIDHANMTIDNNSVMTAFNSVAGAELILTNSATFQFRNNMPFVQDWKPLSLSLNDGATWYAEGSYYQPYANNWGTNANSFGGPVRLNGSVSVAGQGKGSPVSFGPVSGSGKLNVTKARLQLASSGNTYTGDIVVDGTGANLDMTAFRLWRGADMPPAESLKIKNAMLVLSDNDAVTLPPITVEGAAKFVGGPATNPAVRSVTVSLVKTGDGELFWDSSLDVTGVASVEGGVLRLAKPKLGNPGLGEGKNQSENGEPFNYYYSNGATSWNQAKLQYCSTIRREGPAAAFSRTEWRYYTCAYYHGYVWNRTENTVTWDLASFLGTYAYLYVDGQRIDGVTSGPGIMSAQGSAKSYPITLTPGAHEVAFYFVDQKTRFDAQNKSIPGPTIGWYHEWWPWLTCAFAYDPNGASGGAPQSWGDADGKAYALAHFVPFKDPGDGSLFTIDNKTTDEIDQRGYHPGFSNLVVKAGAAIDLNGNDLAVGRLGVGTGVISNGTLTVKGGFSLSTANLGEGPTVKGAVTILDGATLEIDETVKTKSGTYVLLTAEGGITGRVTVDREAHPDWTVRVNGNTVEATRERGLMLLVR